MKYRNVKTGQVVITTGRVSGENWEIVEPKKPKAAEAPKKPAGKKKAGGEGA